MKVHYISPYSTTSPPNIGGAINEAIRQLSPSDDDWIVHTDQDICFLRPDSKKQIEEVLSSTDYDVLGCLTNRLASPHQLYGGKFNEDSDIRNHIAIANECHKSNYGMVKETSINIAAMLMCFRVKTWKEVGGFKENSIRFDSEFTDAVQARGGKLGIMQGVYVFHLYRMWSEDPVWEVGHLTG
jgi:hypothetical protein